LCTSCTDQGGSQKEKVADGWQPSSPGPAVDCAGQAAVGSDGQIDIVLSYWITRGLPFAVQQVPAKASALLFQRFILSVFCIF